MRAYWQTGNSVVAAKPATSFGQLSSILIGGALVGKALGFLREVLMAHAIGVTITADSFRGATTAIMLPLALLQGDVVPAVLIPLAKKWRGAPQSAHCFTSLTLILFLISSSITLFVEIFASSWVPLLVGGFSPEATATTVSFVRIMAFSMPASIIFNCLASIETVLGRARLTSIRALTQNVGTIVGILSMIVIGNPIAIAWGYTTVLIGLAVFGTLSLINEGELQINEVRLDTAYSTFVSFLLGLRTMIALPIAEQVQIWVERLLASSSEGTLAALDYARTMTDSTVTVVAQPIGFAILAHTNPDMTRAATQRRIRTIAEPLLIVTLPASALLMCFSEDIIRVVLAHGAFGSRGIALTSNALFSLSAGLWAATLGLVLLRQLNGQNRNGHAAIVYVQAYAASILFTIFFAPRLGTLAFGLAESLRGLLLLAGTTIALGCSRTIVSCVAQTVPACIVLWMFSFAVHPLTADSILRVGSGGIVYIVLVCITMRLFMPEFCRSLSRWLVKPFSL